jgi:hypothetical protein
MSPVKKRTKYTASDLKTQVEKRNQLADLLSQAAEIEHDVMLQYLFAAFSLKKTIAEGGVNYAQLEAMRGWATTMMLVARQEMEHLGLVLNLLTAIGEAPILRRPSFPIPARTFPMNLPSSLDKFSPDTVLRFVCYEMPKAVSADNKKYLSRFLPNFDPGNYDGIYRTYVEIEKLFEDLREADLFIGPASAQFYSGWNSLLGRGMARGMIYPIPGDVAQQPIYDISMIAVNNLSDVKKVIHQIIEEGEGANEESTTSHFARFLEMHEQLTDMMTRDSSFQPARNVLSNPQVAAGGSTPLPGVNYISNPDTQRVMRLFDLAYGAMLLMLMRYFAHTDESDSDLVALQNTVFFPMMTVGIRPLGEILTQLPAHEPALSARAGPGFTLTKSLQLLPHRNSAWRIIRSELEALAYEANEIRRVESFSPEIRDRLALTSENFARMAMNFKDEMNRRKTQ